MSSKLLAFLGLTDNGDVIVESHRKRRSDYMKRIERLVVPDDGNGEAVPAPENIVTAPSDEQPLEEPAVEPELELPSASAAEPESVEEENVVEEEDERPSSRSGSRGKEKKSLASRLFRSLRRPKENDDRLILVRRDTAALVGDIKEALVDGRTVLIDFAREEHGTMERVARDLINFVRTHRGAFYPVTATSMLLCLNVDSVVEWRAEEDV